MNTLFEIKNIDPMGQGVSKVTDKVTFIPKVLPGEKGTAQVYASKSKVQFASMVELTRISEMRIEPSCQHYANCPSCHFLHTDYKNEISFKKETLEGQVLHFLKHTGPVVSLHQSPKRDNYRNRIQLHYDKKRKLLGHYDRSKNTIIEVLSCLIANDNVKQEMKSLYTEQRWLSLVEKAPSRGHIEIYDNDHETRIEVNKQYAAGGFTQVNSLMNDQAVDIIYQQYNSYFSGELTPKVLDLFGGKGNLSKKLMNSSTAVIDVTEHSKKIFEKHQTYYQLSLYEDDTLEQLKKIIDQPSVDLIILDPPRSGFKELSQYVKSFSPKHIIYMSCQSDTALRDISKLEGYHLTSTHLLDFFPSTYHFESLFFLSKD